MSKKMATTIKGATMGNIVSDSLDILTFSQKLIKFLRGKMQYHTFFNWRVIRTSHLKRSEPCKARAHNYVTGHKKVAGKGA